MWEVESQEKFFFGLEVDCFSALVLENTPKLRVRMSGLMCENYHVSKPPPRWHGSCPAQSVPTFLRASSVLGLARFLHRLDLARKFPARNGNNTA